MLGGLPVDLWAVIGWLWSLDRSSRSASVSRCQWQSLDSSDDVTCAGGSQWEHVYLEEYERRRRGGEGASEQSVSVSYLQTISRVRVRQL